MNPTISDLHVSAALTDLSVAYAQGAEVFVANRAFPTVPVRKQADKYFIFDKGDWLRSQAEPRAPGAPIAMSGWKTSQDSYFCDRWGLEPSPSFEIPSQTRGRRCLVYARPPG